MTKSDAWWRTMRKKGYSDEEIRQIQSANGSLGGSVLGSKGLARLKETNPEKFEEIRQKALETRRKKLTAKTA